MDIINTWHKPNGRKVVRCANGKVYNYARWLLLVYKPITQAWQYDVHHIDGNCHNDAIENLAWILKAEHKAMHGMA